MLRETPSLNRVASNPLLCALLCAYHQLGREFIPDRPHELARELSELILEKRDRERGIQEENYSPAYRALGFDNKRELTERIAYHIIENAQSGRSEGLRENVRGIVRRYVARIPNIGEQKADEVLRGFVERSGMLKETRPSHLGFIHNFFKEYHASAEYVRNQDFPKLAHSAHDAAIRPVVIFSAARDEGTTPMIEALLALSPDEWPHEPDRFDRERDLLALQCGATGRPHDYIDDLVRRRAELFPPRGMGEARAIAELGDDVVRFLSYAENKRAKATEQAACIRALTLIGTPRAEAALQDYHDVKSKSAAYELARYVEPLSITRFRVDFLKDKWRGTIPHRLLEQIKSIAPLSGLTGLERLILDGTQVSDLSPLSGLTALKLLDLDGTQVSDLSPLSSLTGLETCYLSHTQVSDLLPLSGLRGLKVVHLYGTQVSDLSPLSGLTGLETLMLRGTQVSDLSPLSGLTGLKDVDLERTQVSDLSPLSGLTGLKDVDLDGTQVSDLSPLSSLTSLTGLERLILIGTQVSDLSPLSGLTGLEMLILRGTQVSDLSPLSGLNGLRIVGHKARMSASRSQARP